MADATLASRQRQTTNGRRAFLDKFPSPEARSQHFRDLARRSADGRIVLSSAEAAALGEAYALLTRIASRGKITLPDSVSTERTAA